MLNFIIKRLLISLLIVFIVSVFAFSLMHILPGDPARIVLGESADQSAVDALRAKMNLDKPIPQQYFLWISGVFKGDWGYSIIYSRPVGDILSERVPRTLAITIPAMIISVIVGILCGILSATKRGKLIDQIISIFSTLGIGMPQFWVAVFGILIFAVQFKILPIQGFTPPTKDFNMYVQQAILPVFAMSITLIASVTRQTRSGMLEVMHQDYIRTARANGLSQNRVVLRHALRNALITVVTIIALQVRVVIGGSVIVEQVFNIPGIGTLMLTAITERDYMIVQSCVLIISMCTVGANLIADISYGLIDPKIRKTMG